MCPRRMHLLKFGLVGQIRSSRSYIYRHEMVCKSHINVAKDVRKSCVIQIPTRNTLWSWRWYRLRIHLPCMIYIMKWGPEMSHVWKRFLPSLSPPPPRHFPNRLTSVDLFYLHAPDHNTPIVDTLRAVHELQTEGLFRVWGVSNYTAWETVDIWHICKWAITWVHSNQVKLGEYIGFCRSQVLIIWSPGTRAIGGYWTSFVSSWLLPPAQPLP